MAIRYKTDIRGDDNVSAFQYFVASSTEPADRFRGRRWRSTSTTVVAGVPPYATATWDGAAWVNIQKHVLTAGLNLFVNSATGANTNDGLTAGTAFATIQYALDMAAWLDLGNAFNIILISVADGTYNEALRPRDPIGFGVVRVFGNATTPANVIINGGVGAAITVDGFRRFQIGGLTLQGANGIVVSNSGRVSALGGGAVRFGACTAAQIRVSQSAQFDTFVALQFAGNAEAAIFAFDNGLFFPQQNNAAFSFVGNPTYTVATVVARTAGIVSLAATSGLATNSPAVFTGTVGGTAPRYIASDGGLIATRTGDINRIPGGAAGTTATGGTYT